MEKHLRGFIGERRDYAKCQCARCGVLFEAANPNAKYCPGECRTWAVKQYVAAAKKRVKR